MDRFVPSRPPLDGRASPSNSAHIRATETVPIVVCRSLRYGVLALEAFRMHAYYPTDEEKQVRKMPASTSTIETTLLMEPR